MSTIGQSLWPVMLYIANLPPEIRINAEYILLGGLWLGPVKPTMKIILEPIIKAIDEIDLPLQI